MTPKLVSLAKRLEGKPFHLVASHCQATSSKKEVVSYLKANGMSPYQPNMTVTSNGSHTDVKGTGFVPYYIIFDHTGKLVAHHMCGSYHGGDGWKMIEIVDDLLKQAPAIYLGPEPYKKLAPLAQKAQKGKGLGGVVKTLDSKLASEPDAATKAEAERMLAVLTRHRDRAMTRALALEGSQPSELLSQLKKLAGTFRGSSLAPPLEEKLKELSSSEALKDQVAMEKKFRSTERKYLATKENKRTDAFIDSVVKKLEKLIEGKEDLPFATTIENFLADLR